MRIVIAASVVFLALIFFGCESGNEQKSGSDVEQPVVHLSELTGETYEQIVKQFGQPASKTGYTIENAPTKGWNHSALFSQYPNSEENGEVQIIEVSWDQGDFLILACFHNVEGKSRCLVAKRIKKDVRF